MTAETVNIRPSIQTISILLGCVDMMSKTDLIPESDMSKRWKVFGEGIRTGSHLDNESILSQIAEIDDQVLRQGEIVGRYTENLTGRAIQMEELNMLMLRRCGLAFVIGDLSQLPFELQNVIIKGDK